MKKAVLQKLKSEYGATLSMALMLFMICAVAGAIILAAATVASGRFSQLTESDARYYTVISSAELLAQELAETPVEIAQTRTVKKDSHGNILSADTYETTINGVPEPTRAMDAIVDRSFLTARAMYLLFGTGIQCNTEAAYKCSMLNGNAEESSEKFQIHHSGEYSDTDVTWTFEMAKDGMLNIRLHNTKDSEDHPYTIVLTLRAVIDEQITESGGETPDSIQTGLTEDHSIYTTKETKTSIVTWKFGSIQKEVS